ncbi:MAG: phosphoesterase, partial [Lachnospiraceae bacterium]
GRFEWVRDYAELHDNGRKVILSHYPIMCYNGQYRRSKNGNATTWMLYGHVHDTMDQRLMDQFIQITQQTLVRQQRIPCQMINCFCMYSNYVPLTLDEWIVLTQKSKLKNM